MKRTIEERVGETMNWLHEGDIRLCTKKRLAEAADYYQGLYLDKSGEINHLRTEILIFAINNQKPQ